MALMVLLKGLLLSLVIAVPVYYLASKGVRARFFLLGALAWVVAIIAKVVAVIPAGSFAQFIKKHGIMPEIGLSLYSGLLTGVFECGFVLLFVLYIKSLNNGKWNDLLGFGVGFAAPESIIPGVAFLIFGAVLLMSPEVVNQISPEVRDLAIPAANLKGFLMVVASMVERAGAIVLHTFTVLLIFLAVRKREWKWFWIAFVYKFAVDATSSNLKFAFGDAVFTSAGTLWLVEVIMLVFDILALFGILYLKKHKWEENNEKGS